MNRVTILQLSDFAPEIAWAEWMPALSDSKRQELRADREHALHRANEIILSEKIDMVVCPGGLWDDRTVSAQEAASLLECFRGFAPIPVLIAPGDLDPYSRLSYYCDSYYRSETGAGIPDNIFVFRNPRWEYLSVPSLPTHVLCGFGSQWTSTATTNHVSPGSPHPTGQAVIGVVSSLKTFQTMGTPPPSVLDISRHFSYCAVADHIVAPSSPSYYGVTVASGEIGSFKSTRFNLGRRKIQDIVISTGEIGSSLEETITRAIQLSGAAPQDLVKVQFQGPATSSLLSGIPWLYDVAERLPVFKVQFDLNPVLIDAYADAEEGGTVEAAVRYCRDAIQKTDLNQECREQICLALGLSVTALDKGCPDAILVG